MFTRWLDSVKRTAVKNCFNYVDRASRQEVLDWCIAIIILLAMIFCTVVLVSVLSDFFIILTLLGGLLLIASLIPTLSLIVRRLHDSNKSGWNILWAVCIPMIGWIYLFYLVCKEGDFSSNQYGTSPNRTLKASSLDDDFEGYTRKSIAEEDRTSIETYVDPQVATTNNTEDKEDLLDPTLLKKIFPSLNIELYDAGKDYKEGDDESGTKKTVVSPGLYREIVKALTNIQKDYDRHDAIARQEEAKRLYKEETIRTAVKMKKALLDNEENASYEYIHAMDHFVNEKTVEILEDYFTKEEIEEIIKEIDEQCDTDSYYAKVLQSDEEETIEEIYDDEEAEEGFDHYGQRGIKVVYDSSLFNKFDKAIARGDFLRQIASMVKKVKRSWIAVMEEEGHISKEEALAIFKVKIEKILRLQGLSASEIDKILQDKPINNSKRERTEEEKETISSIKADLQHTMEEYLKDEGITSQIDMEEILKGEEYVEEPPIKDIDIKDGSMMLSSDFIKKHADDIAELNMLETIKDQVLDSVDEELQRDRNRGNRSISYIQSKKEEEYYSFYRDEHCEAFLDLYDVRILLELKEATVIRLKVFTICKNAKYPIVQSVVVYKKPLLGLTGKTSLIFAYYNCYDADGKYIHTTDTKPLEYQYEERYHQSVVELCKECIYDLYDEDKHKTLSDEAPDEIKIEEIMDDTFPLKDWYTMYNHGGPINFTHPRYICAEHSDTQMVLIDRSTIKETMTSKGKKALSSAIIIFNFEYHDILHKKVVYIYDFDYVRPVIKKEAHTVHYNEMGQYLFKGDITPPSEIVSTSVDYDIANVLHSIVWKQCYDKNWHDEIVERKVEAPPKVVSKTRYTVN